MDNQKIFFFFGKLIGKALFDRIPVNLCLNRQIYMALLKQTSTDDYSNLEEFKNIDSATYNTLKFFRDEDLSLHSDTIEQYFQHSIEGGNTIDLVPGGSSKLVTNLNKAEFLRLKCHYIGYKGVKSQLD